MQRSATNWRACEAGRLGASASVLCMQWLRCFACAGMPGVLMGRCMLCLAGTDYVCGVVDGQVKPVSWSRYAAAWYAVGAEHMRIANETAVG